MPDADDFERSQGLIAPEMALDQERFESADPRDLVQAVVDFVNWALWQARLRRGEFPGEALVIYTVDYYCAQVVNGGHRQFAYNSKMLQGAVSDVSAGLAAFGTPELAAIWSDFLAALKADPALAQIAIQESARLGNKTPELQALDERFYAVDGDGVLCKRMADWLRSLTLLKGLDAEALQEERAAIIARNLHFAARQAHAVALQAAADAKNPLLIAAKALCAKAGLTFQGLAPAGGYTKKADEIAWGVRTSQGPRFLLLGPAGAVLYRDAKRTQPVAGLKASDMGSSA